MEQLKQRAFHQGPAWQANQLIDDVRKRVESEQGKAVSYEVVLTGKPFSYLQQEVAPRLALYLHDKRASQRSTFLSLFIDETLFFVRADAFFEVIRTSLGLDPEAFEAVLQRWRRTGQAAVGLPPG